MLIIRDFWQRITDKYHARERSKSWMASPDIKFVVNWVRRTKNKKDLWFSLELVRFRWKRDVAFIVSNALSLKEWNSKFYSYIIVLQRI